MKPSNRSIVGRGYFAGQQWACDVFFFMLPCCLQRMEADIARWEQEIPADRAAAEQLGTQLEAAEQKLQELQDGIKEEVEGYHQQLTKVRC